MHSGREYISVLDNYSKVVGGPTPSQIASSLGLVVGPSRFVEFILEPKSRRGNTQVIGGVVVSIKLIDTTGPSWMLVLKEIYLPRTRFIVREKEIKIYYHSSKEGIILSE